MNTTLKRFIKDTTVFILIIFAAYFLDFGCIFKKLTGLSCPGCGMTRAWLSFLKGDIKMALYYHPLFWMVAVLPFMAFLRKRISDKLVNILLISCIVMLMGCYLIRLFSGSDIVSFNSDESLIIKAFLN